MTMTRTPMLLGAAVVALALAGTAVAPSAPGSAFELDLVSRSTGARVASLSGTVGSSGRGFASIVPLSGASTVGMGRGEAAQARRLADGRLLVVGGLGTRVIIKPAADHRHAAGVGRLALTLNSGKAVRVGAVGMVSSSAFHPRPKQLVIVIGTSTGAVHDAMASRYRLVKYSPGTYSRQALLANPALYAKVAGLLVGNSVSRSALAKLDLARSLYNAGRWVATSGSPTALDQHMYVVAHAHLGTAGVMIRRATPALGGTSNAFMQVREPRIAYVRVGQARTGAYATPKRTQLNAAVSAGASDLQRSIARDEVSAGGGSSTVTATETAGSGVPGGGVASSPAVLSIPVHQLLSIMVSTPTVPGVLSPTFTCTKTPSASGGTLNFFPATPSAPQPGAPQQPACPTPVTQQTVSLDYDPTYSVSLQVPPVNSQTPDVKAPWLQAVSETTATSIDAVAQPSAAMGMGSTFNPNGGGYVQPATWGTLQSWNYSPGQSFERGDHRSENGVLIPTCVANQPCSGLWGTLYNTPQEAGLSLAEAVHSVTMACSGCVSTDPGDGPVSVAYNQLYSEPSYLGIELSGGSSTGSNWDTSTTTSTGWQVGGNLGSFGAIPTGGLSGGYNSSTAQTKSQGGQYSTSTSFSWANWVTNGTGQQPQDGSPAQALYTSISDNIPGAQGTAAPAAASLNFGQIASSGAPAAAAYVASPGPQYGTLNPGPACFPATGPGPCLPQVSPTAWGSQMNAENFLQGSVSAFNVDAGSSQLSLGTVVPYTMDNLFLADQMVNSNSPFLPINSCYPGANGTTGCGNAVVPWGITLLTQLQIVNMGQTVSAAQAQPNGQSQTIVPGTPVYSPAPDLATSLTTYYNGAGQVLTGAGGPSATGVRYTTLGLDLCSPAVLTAELWAAGCNNAPGLAGPPATAPGAGPTITAAKGLITTSSKGQAQAATGTALTCNKGTWSGSPSYAYQWKLWNATLQAWGNIAGATQSTYTPTAPGYVLCDVIATNRLGSDTGATPSVQAYAPAAG